MLRSQLLTYRWIHPHYHIDENGEKGQIPEWVVDRRKNTTR